MIANALRNKNINSNSRENKKFPENTGNQYRCGRRDFGTAQSTPLGRWVGRELKYEWRWGVVRQRQRENHTEQKVEQQLVFSQTFYSYKAKSGWDASGPIRGPFPLFFQVATGCRYCRPPWTNRLPRHQSGSPDRLFQPIVSQDRFRSSRDPNKTSGIVRERQGSSDAGCRYLSASLPTVPIICR